MGKVLAAVLDHLTGERPRPRCPRCGGDTRLLSEDPVQTFPPLFQIDYHCAACGTVVTRYRAIETSE